MTTEHQIANLISTVNQQKAEMMYLHILVASLYKELPNDLKARALNRFDKAAELAQSRLLYSNGSDELATTFDAFVKGVDSLID